MQKTYSKVLINIVLNNHDKGILNKDIYKKYNKYLTINDIRTILKQNKRGRFDYYYKNLMPLCFHLIHRKGFTIGEVSSLLKVDPKMITQYCNSKGIYYPSASFFKTSKEYRINFIKYFLDNNKRVIKNEFIIPQKLKDKITFAMGDKIIELNKKRISIIEMIQKYNIPLNYKEIDLFLYENNIKPLGWEKLSYSINPNFFEEIDTEEKAYWLGFLMADGCIIDGVNEKGYRDCEVRLQLQLKDYNHIVKFKKFTNTHRNITKILHDNKYWSCGISFSSVKVVDDLKKWGVVKNKSLIAKFPQNIPKKLIKHFIRGLVDGDGGIPLNNRGYPVGFSFCGAYDIVINVKNFLNIEDKYVKIKNRPDFLEIRINKLDICYNILTTLYGEASIYLERKYQRYLKFLDYYSTHKQK